MIQYNQDKTKGVIKTDTTKKPHTSYEVQKRYHDKTYKRYNIALHIKNDIDIINFMEREKKLGISPTEILRKLYRGKYD